MRFLYAVCLVTVAACSSATNGPSTESPTMSDTNTTSAVSAIELSASAFDAIDADVSDYTVIRAERQLPGETWLVTYKRTDLVPARAGAEVGKGGEVFVTVDVVAATATVTGYGE